MNQNPLGSINLLNLINQRNTTLHYISSAPIKNPQGIPRTFVIHMFHPLIHFSKFSNIESIERTSSTCSAFGRPSVISTDLNFSYINATNISLS
ncbi:LOW QUALITY PROTEIN: hypothetical protein N665_0263s0024 [Sinapis alba]|nr:LOW QUALITY PROTEIN: hypothetical protein N665_0263s0024 [Sinapis alba]